MAQPCGSKCKDPAQTEKFRRGTFGRKEYGLPALRQAPRLEAYVEAVGQAQERRTVIVKDSLMEEFLDAQAYREWASEEAPSWGDHIEGLDGLNI